MPESLRRLVGDDRSTVARVLLARAEATPDARFILDQGTLYSFSETVANARRFAGLAVELGFRAGGRIASYLDNRAECFWIWFGTYLGGGTYVPINRGHRGVVLADMLARSSAEILVVEASAIETLPAADATGVKKLIVIDPEDGIDAVRELGYEAFSYSEVDQCSEAPIASLDPSDIANVMYTSGTTGRSKAVLVPQNQLCRGGARVLEVVDLSSDDVFHGWVPLFHLGAQQDGVVPSLIAGASYALFPTFSLSSFWDEIAQSRSTIFGGFSAMVELLWNLPQSPSDPDNTLRVGLIGLIPPSLHKRFEERFDVRLFEVYGLTEAEPLAMPRPDEETPVGSCGRPTPDFEVVVVDEHDQPVDAGVHGEIVARSRVPDVMMRGYEGDDAATVAAFRNLWFHTGDLGFFDENGFLFFVDRLKHAIRRRGENVSSWEVEAILRSHPDVADVAVVAMPSPLGEDDIKAFIVRSPKRDTTAEEIHSFCQGTMAKFMVPRFISFVDELPYTETGKLRKESLGTLNEETWDAEATRGSN